MPDRKRVQFLKNIRFSDFQEQLFRFSETMIFFLHFGICSLFIVIIFKFVLEGPGCCGARQEFPKRDFLVPGDLLKNIDFTYGILWFRPGLEPPKP